MFYHKFVNLVVDSEDPCFASDRDPHTDPASFQTFASSSLVVAEPFVLYDRISKP